MLQSTKELTSHSIVLFVCFSLLVTKTAKNKINNPDRQTKNQTVTNARAIGEARRHRRRRPLLRANWTRTLSQNNTQNLRTRYSIRFVINLFIIIHRHHHRHHSPQPHQSSIINQHQVDEKLTSQPFGSAAGYASTWSCAREVGSLAANNDASSNFDTSKQQRTTNAAT